MEERPSPGIEIFRKINSRIGIFVVLICFLEEFLGCLYSAFHQAIALSKTSVKWHAEIDTDFKTLSCAELISASRQISMQPSKVSSA